MRSIRNIQGVNLPGRRVSLKDARVAGFRAGQSPTWTRTGFACVAAAVIVWIVLLLFHTLLALAWTGICIVALLLWAATYWTVGDSDEHESHRAQSTPGFDQGPIDQQVHDVIHQHDHH